MTTRDPEAGRLVANSERIAMAAALYEAKFVCDYGEDVDRLMDALRHRGFVLSLDDGSGLFSDKIVAAIEAEAVVVERERIAEAVRAVGENGDYWEGWNEAIGKVLAPIEAP
jgi:hypothetical protein